MTEANPTLEPGMVLTFSKTEFSSFVTSIAKLPYVTAKPIMEAIQKAMPKGVEAPKEETKD